MMETLERRAVRRRGELTERITESVTYSPPSLPDQYHIEGGTYFDSVICDSLEGVIRGDYPRDTRNKARAAREVLCKRAPSLPDSLLPLSPQYPNITREGTGTFQGSAAGFDIYCQADYLTLHKGTPESVQVIQIERETQSLLSSGERLSEEERREVSAIVFPASNIEGGKSLLLSSLVGASGEAQRAATAWQAWRARAEERGKRRAVRLATSELAKLSCSGFEEARLSAAFDSAKVLCPSLRVIKAEAEGRKVAALEFETPDITLTDRDGEETRLGELLVRLCVYPPETSRENGRIRAYLRSLKGEGVRSINGHIHPNANMASSSVFPTEIQEENLWQQCCLGQGEERVARPLRRGAIDLAVLGMLSWANTYGYESPHFHLEEWLGSRIRCNVTHERYPESEIVICDCGRNCSREVSVRDSRSANSFCPYCERTCKVCGRVTRRSNTRAIGGGGVYLSRL